MLNPREIFRMQQEARKMQKRLREKKVVGESKDGNVKIFMNAAQEFEDIWVDEEILDAEYMDRFKKDMKEAFKDYQKNLQKEMAADMDLDQLKSLLS